MNICVITQARFGSSRLRGKILETIDGIPLLKVHLDNAKKSLFSTKFIVAIANEPEASIVANIAAQAGWEFYIGSKDNVLERFYYAAKNGSADVVIRLTSDCPFVQPDLMDELIKVFKIKKMDYIATSLNFPDGVDVEIFSFRILKEAFEKAKKISDKEHVTPWITRNAKKILYWEPNDNKFKDIRLTVDEPEDLKAVNILAQKLGVSPSYNDYCQYIINTSNEFFNQRILRNEGYQISIKNEE